MNVGSNRFPALLGILCLSWTLQSCGYTSQTLLPGHIQSVHVPKVANEINIANELSSEETFKVYRPGLEVELRNAVIDRFIFDGHLKVESAAKANAVLKMSLLEFRRDPLRYNADDSIQEFRLTVVASARLKDALSREVIWSEPRISGSEEYFLSGESAKSEDEAVAKALEDLARHLVEGILEVW